MAEWRVTKVGRAIKMPSKTMLTAFFGSYGIIHREFVPLGKTITGALCEEVLGRLKAVVKGKRFGDVETIQKNVTVFVQRTSRACMNICRKNIFYVIRS